MCGGLIVATVRSRAQWAAYHFGRLFGYLCLGATAGYMGSTLLKNQNGVHQLSLVSTLLLAAGFIFAGVRVWQRKPPHVSILPQKLINWLYRKANGKAWAVGVLTALLPCGWLHVFVLGAATTRSAFLGASFLLMFWLGTLPALSAAPWLVKRVFKPISLRAPRLAAILLLSAGILSVTARIIPLFAADRNATHCQCHDNSTDSKNE